MKYIILPLLLLLVACTTTYKTDLEVIVNDENLKAEFYIPTKKIYDAKIIDSLNYKAYLKDVFVKKLKHINTTYLLHGDLLFNNNYLSKAESPILLIIPKNRLKILQSIQGGVLVIIDNNDIVFVETTKKYVDNTYLEPSMLIFDNSTMEYTTTLGSTNTTYSLKNVENEYNIDSKFVAFYTEVSMLSYRFWYKMTKYNRDVDFYDYINAMEKKHSEIIS